MKCYEWTMNSVWMSATTDLKSASDSEGSKSLAVSSTEYSSHNAKDKTKGIKVSN